VVLFSIGSSWFFADRIVLSDLEIKCKYFSVGTVNYKNWNNSLETEKHKVGTVLISEINSLLNIEFARLYK
jgi:hypothetical protein